MIGNSDIQNGEWIIFIWKYDYVEKDENVDQLNKLWWERWECRSVKQI